MMKAARMIRKCHARFASMLLAESQNVRLWRCRQGFPLLATVFSLLLCTFSWAIPANYPIVNTATSAYQVAGKGYSSSASATIVTDNNAGNSAPSKIELNGLTVEENSPGAIISPILVEDLDGADVHTFALSDSRFQIVSGNLKLRDEEFLDFESEPVVVLTIIAADPSGETVSSIVEITVLNVNESPEDIILSNHSVDADTPGAVVGDLTIVDPDVGDTFTYAIDDVRFVIVEGQLLVSPDEFLPAGPSLSIEITVTDAGGLFYLEIFTLEVTQKFKPSEIRFSALLDGGFGLNGEGNDLAAIDIAASQCRLGTAQPAMYIESPVPRKSTSSVIAVPGLHQLVDTSVFKSGDTAFFKLIDDSANLSSVDIDLVVADIISSTGDQESIQFFETDMDSGVFAGYIQTQAIALMPNDCVLSVAESSEISIRYTDALDSTDISTAEALVDPVSVVFDSGSGRRINGVRITIVDALTSQPADVAGDDSVSAYPASLLSGGSLVDSAGVNYSFSDGAYRFPFLKSGQYKFEVETPNRFAFPSQQPDAVLQNLVGGPYNLSLSSRGGEFVLAASGTPNIDIPLDLLPVIASDSSLELFVYAGSLGAETQNVYVEETLCRSGEQYLEQSAPITAAGLLQLPATLALVPATHVTRGEAVFIRLTDSDQDLDAYAPDQILIEVRVSDSGETEQLLLSETGDSTGEFTGFIQSELSVGSMLDCKLGAAAGAVFDVSYQDAQDNTDSTVVSGRLDRAFTVFDSHSGQALSGVSITLVDVTTGQPALILSDDGISAYPATVVSGQSVVDSAGRQFDFMPGEFRYPALAEGDYRLELVAPPSYTYPSVLSDEEINLSPAREFTLTPASRGNDFKVLAGELLAFDLPLDPFSTEVFVTKISSQQIVSVGDFVQYSVSVENPHATGSISNLTLRDILPPGFRLVEDSSYYTGAGLGIEQIEPFISDDGRTLSYQISQLAPASKFTLKYVAHVTAGAQMGTAVNSASLSGTGVGTSNIATASVRVGEDLFQSKATIVGRVTNGGCGADAVGFSQARIFLEDGSYVVSDSEGNFHFEGVEPGTHVVQLDVASLPESHQIISCSDSTAFAGTDFSKFVDVAAGSLWRADFYLGKKPPLLEHIRSRLFSEVINEGTGQGLLNLRYILSIGDIALKNIKSVILLPEKLAFVPGSAILNDVAMDDPAGFESNALTFRMQDSSAPQILELSFQVVARAPARDVELKAVTLFETSEQPLKTPVLKNTVTLLERRPQTAAHAAEYGYKTAMHIHRPEGATSVSASINQTTSGTGIPERVDSDLRIANLKSTDAPESMARSRNVANTSPLNTLVSDFGVVEVLADRKLKVGSRITMPLLDEEIVPSFDINWLVLQNSQPEIVWPILGSNPRIPTTDVYVKHNITERIRVFIEGVEVSPLSFEGVNVVPAGTKAISRWRNIPLVNGDNHVEVQIDNGSGEPLLLSQNVHFSGSPIRAEFVPELSQLDADGLTPAVIAVRFFDRDGYPVRPGLTGSFTIEAPFKVYNEALLQSQIDPSLVQQVVEKYLVVRDGTAYIQLEPSTQTGEVKLRFEFGDNRFDEVSARLVPSQRDWVLVGFGEGSAAYKMLSGNMTSAKDAGIRNKLGADGRVAFYAKGQIAGRWLMTIAYDTDKQSEHSLGQQIDPNKFYTLYGDGTEQRYDAQSQRKLFLQIERSDFNTLFGDYDTSFDGAELTRYNRRFNGFKSEYFGNKWQAKVFAAKSDLAHVRDEIQGDGTSGKYRLSRRSLVINSERLVIETRDRFRSEVILSEESFTRHADYSIDYEAGTIIFKRPVASHDNKFNPRYIVAEYEVEGLGQGRALVAGTRVTGNFNEDKTSVSGTYIHDDTSGAVGQLGGLDIRWQVNDNNRIIAEVAHSDTEELGRGSAYLVQLEHQSTNAAGLAYVREQEQAFGMGQQNVTEAGTRKIGIEGEYSALEGIQLRALAYRQMGLEDESRRTVAEARAEYRLGRTSVNAGLRSVDESLESGGSSNAKQITLGAGHTLMENRLLLNATAELDISSSSSAEYPDRVIFGGEYELTSGVRLLADHEVSWGQFQNTSDSRVGIKAEPWSGANVSSVIQRNGGENGDRLLATTGVLQQWRFKEHWLLDIGFDRVHTLDGKGAPTLPGSTGEFGAGRSIAVDVDDNDFVASFLGIGYREVNWDMSTRLEFHQGDIADKLNFLAGLSRQLSEGRVLSGSISLLSEERDQGSAPVSRTNQSDVRFGLAWRPAESEWMFLNRLDWVYSEQKNGAFNIRTNKLVDNFNANWQASDKAQLSLQFGLKYVLDQIDGRRYHGFTTLVGVQMHFDVAPKWDIGIGNSYLYSQATETTQYAYGMSLGHSPMKNLWVSLGYNIEGFQDEDFIAADYTAQGPYLKFRFKVDQESFRRFLSYAGSRSGRYAGSREVK